ncbi:MAG: dienelactone hydrolase family protein [Alphaproteobacteria bacterium]
MEVSKRQSAPEAAPVSPRLLEPDGGGVREVEFPSWNPYLPHDMQREDIRNRRFQARGRLFLPDARFPRPRPAVVIVQGLSGPRKEREIAYGHFLARNGYVALMTDSFGSRGLGNAIQIWRALRVTTAMLMADTFGALDYLAAHPQVSRGKIGVVGFSFGGMISVLTAYRRIHDLYLPGGPAFAAHVSYYGSSIPRLEDPATAGAPVFMMLGTRDGNVSIPRSEQIAGDLRRGGSAVDLSIFDAFHQWDGPYRKPHRIFFHLRGCHIRIGNDGSITDEKSGHQIRGPWSRLWFLLRNSVPAGYLEQRDPELVEKTNGLLLSFLEKAFSRQRARARAGPGP